MPTQPVLAAKSWSPRSVQCPRTHAKVSGGVIPSAYPRRRILSRMAPIPLGRLMESRMTMSPGGGSRETMPGSMRRCP
eukprot:8794847-Heterocapsa_arctica.AAC.1